MTRMLLVGGDFNCTLRPDFDRSYALPADRHDSAELRDALISLDLADCLAPEMARCEDESDIQDFRARHHTSIYNKGGGAAASSRTDRWYVSLDAVDWIHSCTVELASGRSDHEGITLRLKDLRYNTHIKKAKRVYPPALPALDAVKLACEDLLSRYDAQQVEDVLAGWDALKAELRRTCLLTAPAHQKRLATGIKQKLRRLRAALTETRSSIQRRVISNMATHMSGKAEPLLESELSGSGSDTSARELAALCTLFEELTLSQSARVINLRNAIATVERKRQTRNQQATFDKYKADTKDSERSFFSRFSVKFGPAVPLQLSSARGWIHETHVEPPTRWRQTG